MVGCQRMPAAKVPTPSHQVWKVWTSNPIQWDNGYFDNLFKYEWELATSPAGAHIWHPKNVEDADMAPEVDGSGKKVLPTMNTADIAMITDPEYRKVSEDFHADIDKFADAFARAWFKLLHRDMGPKCRYLEAQKCRMRS